MRRPLLYRRCNRLEPLTVFDGGKRTCTRMLETHNARRRERYRTIARSTRAASAAAPHSPGGGASDEEVGDASLPPLGFPDVGGEGGPHCAAALVASLLEDDFPPPPRAPAAIDGEDSMLDWIQAQLRGDAALFAAAAPAPAMLVCA